MTDYDSGGGGGRRMQCTAKQSKEASRQTDQLSGQKEVQMSGH